MGDVAKSSNRSNCNPLSHIDLFGKSLYYDTIVHDDQRPQSNAALIDFGFSHVGGCGLADEIIAIIF